MRIGLDLDGVVYKWDDTVKYLIKRYFDIQLADATDWDSYERQLKDLGRRDAWKWLWSKGITEYGMFKHGSLYKGAREGIREIAAKGEIVILTKRPPLAQQDTLEWLAYQKLPTSEIHILNHGRKSDVKCDAYIDDSMANAIDILNNTDGLMLLWDRPWNQSTEYWPETDSRFRRVSSWEEVVNELGELERRRGSVGASSA